MTYRFRTSLILCLMLAAAVTAVYGKAARYDFLNYDDNEYVIENPHVYTGLRWKNIVWAFTSSHSCNWHPLTWISHMIDCELFALDAGNHHLVNVLFHIANTLMLFLLLRRMTGALWRSAFAAALFGLHPLHVESVAWVAERKDVLSTLLFLLTLWSYSRYTEKPGFGRYATVIVLFALGLSAKPMLVTLPAVLLLLDAWPLKRIAHFDRRMLLRLINEKVPLFALAAASCIVTFIVQKHGGSVSSLQAFTLAERSANALVGYAWYLLKMLWPTNLAVLYPHPGMPPLWKIAGSAVLLVLISFSVLRASRRHPYLPVGWLWYLITLVPVIGLVQVGAQAVADRYTYIPLIGLFISLCWAGAAILKTRPATAASISTVILFFFGIVASAQLEHWQNSYTLFKHTVAVTDNNYIAHGNLGVALADMGKNSEAIREYHKALRFNKTYSVAHNNLGFLFQKKGDADQALHHLQLAVRYNPKLYKARFNLAALLAKRGDIEEALSEYYKVLETNPDFAKARINLGLLAMQQGKTDEAIVQYEAALEIDPGLAKAHYNLGIACAAQNKTLDALAHYREAIRLIPDYTDAHYNLANLLLRTGDPQNAVGHFRRALEIDPGNAGAHGGLGLALERAGDHDGAELQYRLAIEADPGSAAARNNLGALLQKQGRSTEALQQYYEVIRLQPESAEGRINAGLLLIRTGRINEAVLHLQAALAIDPGNAQANNNYGAILMHQGRHNAAAGHFRRALINRPGYKSAERNLQKALNMIKKNVSR